MAFRFFLATSALACGTSAKFNGQDGFVVLRATATATPYSSSASIAVGAVAIEDYSTCAGTTATCAQQRVISAPTLWPNANSGPCTLPFHNQVGRMSKSQNGAFLTFTCFRTSPWATISATNNTAATIARLTHTGVLDTTWNIPAAVYNVIQTNNGLHGGLLPTSAASWTAQDVFTVADRVTGAQGLLYLRSIEGNTSLSISHRMRANDGFKVKFFNDEMFIIWGGDSLKVLPPSVWQLDSVPNYQFDAQNAFPVPSGEAMSDLDNLDAHTFFFVGTSGLWRATRNLASGQWRATLLSSQIRPLTLVAVSNNRNLVFVANATRVWAYDLTSGAYVANTAGAPWAIANAPASSGFRGLASIPVDPATVSAPSSSPLPTPTPTLGPMPANGMVAVRVGDGVRPVPDFAPNGLSVTTEVAIEVYNAAGGLDRRITMPATDYWPSTGGQLAFTLLGGAAYQRTAPNWPRWGFQQGRLVIAENRGLLTVAGYQTNINYDLFNGSSSKREPSIARLGFDGSVNHTTPCTAWGGTSWKRIYCNGHDVDEIPMAAATTDGQEFWFTGGDAGPETGVNSPYGIAWQSFDPALSTSQNPSTAVGASDRNDYARVQVFGRHLFFVAQNAAGASVSAPQSALYISPTLPRPWAPMAKPAPSFIAPAGPFGLVTDFDVASLDTVWLGTQGGIVRIDRDPATGNFTAGFSSSAVAVTTGQGAIFVGLSLDGATLFVSAFNVSFSAIYSFDTATLTYNNGGAPILTPPPGYQYRGVAPAPILASSTPTPTSTPTASITPSESTTATSSSSNTASSSVTPSGTSSSSVTASSSATSTPSSSSTGTPSSSGTSSVSLTATPSASTTETSSTTASPTASSSMSNLGGSAPPTVTPSQTETPSSSQTASITPTSSGTASNTPSPSGTASTSPTSTSTATSTPTNSATPSLTASGTDSQTPTATCTPSNTATTTRTPSVTPTATLTTRGAPFPANGFLAVLIGDGIVPVPHNLHVTVPVRLLSFQPCGAGCASASVERTIVVPSANITRDLYGNRMFTCNSGTTSAGNYRSTFRGCKLGRSNDKNMLMLAGYDVWANFTITSKREPSMVRVNADGGWNVQMPCTIPRVPVSWGTNDIMYANGFNAEELPLGIASDNGATYWLAGAEAGYHAPQTSNYGIRRFTLANNTAPVSIGLGDRNDYDWVQAKGNKLWFHSVFGFSTGPAGWVNPQSVMMRFETLPTAGTVTRPAPLFSGNTADWNHFDVFDDSRVYIAGASGLSVGELAVDGTWSWRLLSDAVVALINVAVSNDQATLYATTATFSGSAIYSWDIATSRWNNEGQPIAVAPAGFQFRGISAAPQLGVAPSATRTATPTPTQTPTGSLVAGSSISNTASVSLTSTASVPPSAARTPSATLTPPAPFTPASFVVALIGNGQQAIPALNREVTVPVQLRAYADCKLGCSGSPALLRTVRVNAFNGPDEFGNRPLTVLASSLATAMYAPNVPGVNPFGLNAHRATYRGAKLGRSDDMGFLMLPGFDVFSGFDFGGGKREPAVGMLSWTGAFTTTTPCKTDRVTFSIASDPYYCDGFDGDELPLSFAALDSLTFFYSGGQIPTSGPYGIRAWTPSQITQGSGIAGLSGRNDFDTVKVFRGELYFFTVAGGPESAVHPTAPFANVSALYRLPTLPTPSSNVALGDALLITGSPSDIWNDFDLESPTSVWVAANTGLLNYRRAGASAAWEMTVFPAVTDLLGVTVSNDKSTVYVTRAGGSAASSGVFSFDIASASWNAEAEAILTAPAGYEFRGISAAPIQPSPSVTATSTTSTTASNTASASETSSQTPSSSQTGTGTPSSSATGTGSVTVSPSSTSTGTPSSSETATSSASASGTMTATMTATMSATQTGSPSQTGTASSSETGTASASASETASSSASITATSSATRTGTRTSTGTGTGTRSTTATPTGTRTQTLTPTGTKTPTSTLSASRTETGTPSSSRSGTASASETGSSSASPSASASSSATPTPPRTPSRSLTPPNTPSNSRSKTKRSGASSSRTPKATRSKTPKAPSKTRTRTKKRKALRE